MLVSTITNYISLY